MNTIDFQNYLSWTYFGKDAFDKDEFDRMNQLLEGVTRFIDIGASHGIYSFHANNFLSDTDIICIEADPERFEILKANVAKWAEGSTNRFECILAAASDEQDRKDQPEIPFYTTGTQISGGLFPVGERSDGYKPTTIPLVCIDDFFEEGSNTFIKIDVEGSEMRVLKGATQHIKKRNTKFFVEISWWGDRQRGTSSLDFLRFCFSSEMRVDRRLRSDYLISYEPKRIARISSIIKSMPPLVLRLAWGKFIPVKIRTLKERRQNVRRLARYTDTN